MTDDRLTDLSYGHLGEVSYDIDTQEWRVSRDPFTQNIQQLLPLRSAIPPSIHASDLAHDSKPKHWTKSAKWLMSTRPETLPARPLLSALVRSQPPAHSQQHAGQLGAVGNATDVEQTFGSRKVAIIATSCGEAGHVLRLIRPQIERCEWGRQSSARLSLLNVGSSDQGYWVGNGGRILQVTYAKDGNLPVTVLAVRQANAITILRPLYGATTSAPVAPSGYARGYPPSRINANPVAVLTREQSGVRTYTDMSFNPWYARQFAVVDELGTWSTWDIVGGRNKNTLTKLVLGKRANIYDGYVPDPTLKSLDNADGWHQILWADTVSTIVICSRRHIAVFNVRSVPTRVQTKEFFPASNSDWILDMKRSPSNLSHLLVLTSSRIFWLEIISSREEKIGDLGYRVLLSHRHFRDSNDGTMRFTVFGGEDVSVAIFSEKTSLLNVYTFSPSLDGLGPTSYQGSLNLSKDQDMNQDQLQTLCFLNSPLKVIPNRPHGPEYQYIEEDVKFYQILTVTSGLGLSFGLCSMHHRSTQTMDSIPLNVMPPTRTYIYTPAYMSSKRVVDDPWIIPDDQVEENLPLTNRSFHFSKQSPSKWEARDDQRLTMNFRSIYQQAFPIDNLSGLEHADEVESMSELLGNVLDRIRQAKQDEELSITTFLELSKFPGFSEGLEQGAPILQDFLNSLQLEEDPDASSALVLSSLTQCPGIKFQTFQNSKLPNLLKVYDQIAESWIATLPLQTPSLTRLAKFKIARKVAVELCLSSIGVSLRSKASQVPPAPILDSGQPPAALDKDIEILREDPPALSSQMPSGSTPKASFGLPTPSLTPSLYSQSHASTSEYAEDPTISRLRQYAVSIKSKPDLPTSKILRHWPVIPGVDPATYSWEAIQKKATADESGEDDRGSYRKRREDIRRKRTEKFLSRESTAATEASTQPPLVYTRFGSQPDMDQHAASSQTIDDVPMTQPDRGAFGSRSAQQRKAKQKKKRAAGFR